MKEIWQRNGKSYEDTAAAVGATAVAVLVFYQVNTLYIVSVDSRKIRRMWVTESISRLEEEIGNCQVDPFGDSYEISFRNREYISYNWKF